MISIKKFLESASVDARPAATRDGAAQNAAPEGAAPGLGDALAAYQAALHSMGKNGHRAVPALGPAIEVSLSQISDDLSRDASGDSICESRRKVDEQLTLWADKAEDTRKQNEQTVRELLVAVFEATESTGNRDEKFSREISELSERLRAVAGLQSVPIIRRSILEHARALNSSVARMANEGREAIRKLTSEIAEYQNRLVASERRAVLDPLTGLCNRLGFEQQLEQRVQSRQPFSLLVADLNDFKAVNDLYGHVVGDEILAQFSEEFRKQFVSEDTVARWGGDEFVAIVAGDEQEGHLRADRVRHWVLGEYNVTVDSKTVNVLVDAALGTMAWNGAETGLELFARSDKEMYRVKQSRRKADPPPKVSAIYRASIESAAKSPLAMARRGGRPSVF